MKGSLRWKFWKIVKIAHFHFLSLFGLNKNAKWPSFVASEINANSKFWISHRWSIYIWLGVAHRVHSKIFNFDEVIAKSKKHNLRNKNFTKVKWEFWFTIKRKCFRKSETAIHFVIEYEYEVSLKHFENIQNWPFWFFSLSHEMQNDPVLQLLKKNEFWKSE